IQTDVTCSTISECADKQAALLADRVVESRALKDYAAAGAAPSVTERAPAIAIDAEPRLQGLIVLQTHRDVFWGNGYLFMPEPMQELADGLTHGVEGALKRAGARVVDDPNGDPDLAASVTYADLELKTEPTGVTARGEFTLKIIGAEGQV